MLRTCTCSNCTLQRKDHHSENKNFLLAKQAAVHTTESGSPSRWARPVLSAAGGGSGQRAPRAPKPISRSIFCFFADLFPAARSSTRPCLPIPSWSYRGAPARALTGPLAAASHRKVPAHVGQDLMPSPATYTRQRVGAPARTQRWRCAATASSPGHRATHAARTAARMGACVSKAR